MSTLKKYSGVAVPMVTPFTSEGKIDFDASIKIADSIVNNKLNLFIAGTTGEGPSQDISNKLKFARFMVEKYSGAATIYAGVADNCAAKATELANSFFDVGIDVTAVHLPSYYPIADYQIEKYFESIINRVDGPVILYNITATTKLSIPLEVIEKFSHDPKVVGLKDSERDIDRFYKAIDSFKDRSDFSYFIGWGAKCAEGLLRGADGMVPSTGNFCPSMYAEMYEATLNSDEENTFRLQKETDEIALIYQKDRKLSESLAALKVMMNTAGLCEKNVLQPLTLLEPWEEERIVARTREIISKYNLKWTF